MRNYTIKEGKTPTGEVIRYGTEDVEQETIIEWTKYQMGKYPELVLLYHVPNGGKRSTTEAARFKRMGVKAGVPDLVLPVPRGGYAGAYIELKVPGNRTTTQQEWWIERLRQQGYFVAVCYGNRQAIEKIMEYLEQPKTILFRAGEDLVGKEA